MRSFYLSDDLVEDIRVIRVGGYLDFDVAPQFKRCILRRIDDGERRIVVDLSETGFIDSTAIGVLVGVLKRLKEEDGSLAVVCDDENVRGIFELVGLENVIPLRRSHEEALTLVAQPA